MTVHAPLAGSVSALSNHSNSSGTALPSGSLQQAWWKTAWQTWRQHCWWMLLPALLVTSLATRYQFTVNLTPSLPYTFAVIERGNFDLKQGDLAAFYWKGGWPFPAHAELLKRVEGVSGDLVVRTAHPDSGRYFGFVHVVTAKGILKPPVAVKRFSMTMKPLEQGPYGMIPDQHYFMQADHPDSLDSRYANPGWVRADQLVGKAVWVW